MRRRLEDDCRRIDGGRSFEWAVEGFRFHVVRFVSFAVLKSTLLVLALIAESGVTRTLAIVAMAVAFIAEDLSTDRVIVAVTGSEMVVFDAAPRLFGAARPSVVLQRVSADSVQLRSRGLFSDEWRLDGCDIRIGRTRRSLVEQWVSERLDLSLAGR